MHFLITDSLARLSGDEQKAAKTTAFDLQLNPASPGLSFHKLDQAKDKNFWSVRVTAECRMRSACLSDPRRSWTGHGRPLRLPDLEEVYNTERHLLYVACTRARDQLFVSSVAPASEFLEDLRP